MKKTHSIDYVLLIVVVILILIGMVMIATVSIPLSLEKFGNSFYYLRHQILFGILPALALAILFFKIPLNYLKKYALFLLLANLIALFLIFLPKIGITIKGSSRWLNLGGVIFQPSEFLKITFLLYLSVWLSQKANKSKPQILIAFLIILGILTFLLIKQPDMGTLVVIGIVAILMYFVSPMPFWHTLLIILIGVTIGLLLIYIAPYRLERLITLLRPETIDPLGKGYQIRQSLIAIGSGKIWGIEGIFSLGMSRQKFGFLPHSISDSIFAIIGEEFGFIGCLALVSLFILFFWRGIRIAKNCSDKFLSFVAFGFSTLIIVQAFVNIGSMIGILPLTGVPLPFISYGGSHLVAELIGIGIILNVSKT
ncbi:putative lipid II flippase FtsW [bacterium (Candidatus Gribaldobacteria) CG07_land_8_20_14_0_80_33_18]|uniref:Probable peptidoglycan glycosyltransferase FtsW n=1 Tax=bacterium (Candidatus Gribaldobacteria) CG07_land_8_20_14_0_80_33_18 TaxID=2014272 RepID=A0A2M6Z2Y0_9BACT|nr:MAG: putative lipid II flippase FtsW [bacterium (Candidatus Gribaldobacteria) CG10_big_fil_rev_8_21_14_0_10_33_41]PIU46769.1 MAG: putative lipid II flippase FtsW [bacterium (Candidatus Gribaldobacteria) CG07_land_8_20_14_0_80_33_18]PJA01166.1 MAG: putative lipid II flippase FtsW [bacterium (Candidatus Gribaldobacteria) CG_4_10_14_0_2_um_filter_33_15]